MTNSAHFSKRALVFHGMELPEEATIVGYGAIIHRLGLEAPMPGRIALVSDQHKKYETGIWYLP